MSDPKPKHTEGTLYVAEENCGDGANIAVKHNGKLLRNEGREVRIAHTSAVRSGGEDIVSKAEAEANAAHIVHVWNTHEELADMVRDLLDEHPHNGGCASKRAGLHQQPCNCIIDRANKMLLKHTKD